MVGEQAARDLHESIRIEKQRGEEACLGRSRFKSYLYISGKDGRSHAVDKYHHVAEGQYGDHER